MVSLISDSVSNFDVAMVGLLYRPHGCPSFSKGYSDKVGHCVSIARIKTLQSYFPAPPFSPPCTLDVTEEIIK